MAKLTEQGKGLPLHTRVRLHVAHTLSSLAFRAMPEAYYDDLKAQEVMEIFFRVDGVECDVGVGYNRREEPT